jgi:hypothetical protein
LFFPPEYVLPTIFSWTQLAEHVTSRNPQTISLKRNPSGTILLFGARAHRSQCGELQKNRAELGDLL